MRDENNRAIRLEIHMLSAWFPQNEGVCLLVSYRLGLLAQTDQALEQRCGVVVDGQLLRHELRAIEWVEVSELCVVTERQDPSCWTSLRQAIFGPKMHPAVAFPSPGSDPIATESVHEDDAGLLDTTRKREAWFAHTLLLPLQDQKEALLVRNVPSW